MTTLFVITRKMNGRNQTSQAFVTSTCPFCDCWSKFVYRPNECQVYQFVPSTSILRQFVSVLWTILQPLPTLPPSREMKPCTIALSFCCQFTIPFNASLSMTFHVVIPRDSYCVRSLPPGNFSVGPTEIRDSNVIFCFGCDLRQRRRGACRSDYIQHYQCWTVCGLEK